MEKRTEYKKSLQMWIIKQKLTKIRAHIYNDLKQIRKYCHTFTTHAYS